MADIFISYSRHDSDKAMALVERLQVDGYEVWLDRHGIEGAEQWATEIVEGITHCTTFILLLSPSSIRSENVLKELSLASEKGKRILPVDIEVVMLPSSFEYQVAGIQRVPITDYDAIVRAHRRGVERKKVADLRKSLIILPFEDLSPQKDNQWFADGLAGELISAFGTIKSIRVLDRKTSLDLRGVKQTSREIAQLYDSRYIVEGTVTKLGERIKISASLLDTQTRDHLWQDSFKGTMEDIFELQESVAEKIVDGLKIHLTAEEKGRLKERETDNPEAYTLFLKGLDYFRRQTKEALEAAKELHMEAIKLDPNFAVAYCELANCCTVLYRKYIRNVRLITEAEAYIQRAEELGAPPPEVYRMKSVLANARGDYEEGIRYALLSAEADPEFALAYFALGLSYTSSGLHNEASDAFKNYARLRETDTAGRLNYLVSLFNRGDKELLGSASKEALPVFARHTRLTPDDLSTRSSYVLALHWAGEKERALQEAEHLLQVPTLGPFAIFNLGNILAENGYFQRAVELYKLSIERGFREVESLTEHEWAHLPGFDEVVSLLHQKLEQEK